MLYSRKSPFASNSAGGVVGAWSRSLLCSSCFRFHSWCFFVWSCLARCESKYAPPQAQLVLLLVVRGIYIGAHKNKSAHKNKYSICTRRRRWVGAHVFRRIDCEYVQDDFLQRLTRFKLELEFPNGFIDVRFDIGLVQVFA